METGERIINPQETVNKKIIKVEENNINLAWKTFQPDKISLPEDNNHLKSTVIFLPGWSITEQAKSIETLCQTFANYSQSIAYAINTTADNIIPNSCEKEAEAVRHFIEERKLKNVTLVGNSLGGTEAVHLTAFLQEKNSEVKINGLVLLDSTSLYPQKGHDLATNYFKDLIKTRINLLHPPKMKRRNELALQNNKYVKDGISVIIKGIMNSPSQFFKRTKNEIQEMVKESPHLKNIKTPVIMINGKYDLVSNPEKLLKENIFPKSPYVKMIIPKKMGYHNVSYSRPESTANTALYLLDRFYRSKK